ncbi:MAG: acetate--CoA ligase [Solirubrobacteraceae bacterium]
MTPATTGSDFSWAAERALLDGLPGGGLNIAHEAVDRHAAGPLRDRAALRWLARDGAVRDTTYVELAAQTNRFARLLSDLGVEPGETVFALLGRVPELHVAALGTFKRRAVFCPLYSAFGPEPVAQRLTLGAGTVLVTTPRLYARRVAPVRDRLPALRHVLLVGADAPEAAADVPGGVDLAAELAARAPEWEIPPTSADDIALLHFTSGTTGRPKGALHVHEAVVAHHATGRIALDLRDGDVFWCTADPGWVTGMSYGVITPLTHGVTCLIDEGEFDAARWYETLAEQRVTVWYTAPTAIRMLMRAGADLAREHDLAALRLIASVGEPLNAEAVRWGAEHLGLPIRDTWWQTETGGIMIGNLAGLEVRPGAMGRPLPGIEAAVGCRDDDGELRVDGGAPVMAEDGGGGELLLRAGWPSMFRGYLNEEERYARCFVGGWYRTGDLARRDEDGWYWFLGRGDDVIKSAGHLIGPFEVERVLMEHPAVVEAGVIGVPDEMAGQRIKAFVVLAPGVDADTAAGLPRDLLGFARTRLGAVVAPKEIEVRDELPHTRSGKVMRRLLRARELGLPEGDLSTLETGA